MPSLIHLNGPPGIGKSTLSALYVDRHPGTLNLDIDSLHGLIGGWQDADTHAHEVLRPVALAMASLTLPAAGTSSSPNILRGSRRSSGSNGWPTHGARAFVRWSSSIEGPFDSAVRQWSEDDSPWGRHNRRVVAGHGGSDFLAAMYDRLQEVLRLRPAAVVVRSEAGSVEETYSLLVSALARQ